MADQTKDPTADRIKELETQLASVEKTHAFQAERADKLEVELKGANERHEFQRKRAEKLQAAMKDLQKKADVNEALVHLAENSNYVALDGKAYKIIGDFRADNTFAEVKRGHCPEGVTLIAIDKQH